MTILIPHDALEAAAAAAFRRLGSRDAEAAAVAAHLVGANLAGHDSHGVVRISAYADRLRRGHVVANREPEPVIESGALAVYDGRNGYGQSVVQTCLEGCFERARANGLCAVGVRNVAHLGRLGHYAERAAAAGLASVHFVNTTGFAMVVAPFGAAERRLPTNPVALGIPLGDRDPVIWDVATSAIAEGKVKLAALRGHSVPEGTMIDRDGLPTTDPASLARGGALLPFGGHKGSGLAVMCELFAGALAGGGCAAPGAPFMVNNLFSILIDARALGDAAAMTAEAERLCAWVRSARSLPGSGPVMVPGEVEAETRARRMREGVPFDAADWNAVEATLLAVGVPARDIPHRTA